MTIQHLCPNAGKSVEQPYLGSSHKFSTELFHLIRVLLPHIPLPQYCRTIAMSCQLAMHCVSCVHQRIEPVEWVVHADLQESELCFGCHNEVAPEHDRYDLSCIQKLWSA